jgi:hypothetical protein
MGRSARTVQSDVGGFNLDFEEGWKVTIGLVDVDGHSFPNLALMRISAWHKAQGDSVEWWQGNLFYYDKVYMSKIFSDQYSREQDEPINCGEVVRGGTGYCITLGEDGKEHFDQSKNVPLPPEVEKMFPDYSIYPQFTFAVSMTSRGCPRGCSFCHVAAKEGRCAVKVADVSDFWNGQDEIRILDPNITACREKRELMRQYRETGAMLDFTQGLDIRMLNDADIEDINHMRLRTLHFAWDNPKDDLEQRFRNFANRFRRKSNIGMVYCLTNYNSTMEENLYRIYTLRDLGYDPYVMIYNKPSASKEIRNLQRWCNNKIIFKSVNRFEDYTRQKG